MTADLLKKYRGRSRGEAVKSQGRDRDMYRLYCVEFVADWKNIGTGSWRLWYLHTAVEIGRFRYHRNALQGAHDESAKGKKERRGDPYNSKH